MADLMTFPNTVEEFMEQYKITDTEQVYTNGADLVPIFRMKQWFEHCSEQKKGKWKDGHRSSWDGTRHWYRYCDRCGYERDDDDPVHDSYFCPNCGAEMEGNDE